MEIINRPICGCGKDAVCLVSGIWVCGECVVKLTNKLKEQHRKLIMEIQNG